MDGEAGLPHERLPVADQLVGGRRITQGPRVQLTLLEHLGVADSHHGARCRGGDPQAQATGVVLAEVQQVGALRCARGRDRGELLDAAHGRTVRRGEDREVQSVHLDAVPSGVVEPRLRPAGRKQPRVEGLPVVQARPCERTGRAAPPRPGGDDLCAALGGHLELREQAHVLAVDVPVPAFEAEAAPEPAVGEPGSDRVGPRPQLLRDIEGVDPEALVIGRPAGQQLHVPHARAVQLDLREAVRGDMQARPVHWLLRELELMSQQRGPAVEARALLIARAHELGPPQRLVEAAFGEGRGAPGAPPAVGVLHPHRDRGAFPRREGSRGPGHQNLFAGVHRAAAPLRGGPLRPFDLPGDLVGHLPGRRRLAVEMPGQSRSRFVDAQRGLLVMLDADDRGGCRHGGLLQESDRWSARRGAHLAVSAG